VAREALGSEPRRVLLGSWTAVQETGVPNWSVSRTEGAIAAFVSLSLHDALPIFTVSVEAAPAVAEAVKVRGLPVRPVLVAVRVLERKSTRLNSSHGSTAYAAVCLEDWEPLVSEQLPVLMAKSTAVPETGLPNGSV